MSLKPYKKGPWIMGRGGREWEKRREGGKEEEEKAEDLFKAKTDE